MLKPCPCGNKLTDESCCGRLLARAGRAATAVELMRSRYVAYGDAAVDYLIETTASPQRESLDAADLAEYCAGLRLVSLEILKVKAGGPADSTGEVTFRATLRHRGEKVVQTERSRFARDPETGDWVYVDGVVQ